MIRSGTVILSILLSFLFAEAQSQYSLSGHVVFSEDLSSIPDVEIYHYQSGVTYYSNAEGDFVIDNLSPGDHYFTLFAIGLEPYTDTLSIDSNLDYKFEMSEWNYSLDAIDITSAKEELFATRQLNDIEGTSIYAGKKSEVVILDLVRGNLAQNNGRQVFAQVSGLNIYEGSDGGLQLNLGGRGLDPNRTSNFNTRQNGYDISADVLGYPENYYTPPTESLSEVRIIRGASSLQYGTQFGGLIDFRTRKIPSYKDIQIISNQTVGSFGAFSSFNYIGVNKGKFSINAFYNYKTGNGFRDFSDYDAHNSFVSVGYKFNKSTEITLEYTHYNYLAQQAGGLTDQQFETNPQLSTRERNWFDVDWDLYNMSLSHKVGRAGLLTLNVFALDASRKSVGYRGNPIDLNQNPITAIDEQDSDGNYISPRDLIIGDFNNYGAEVKYLSHYKIADKKSVFLIGSKYYKSDNGSIQGAGSTGSDADFRLYDEQFSDYPNQSNFRFPNLNVSAFVENIFYLNDKISLIPGARFEYIKTEAIGDYNQVVFDNAGNPIANSSLSDDNSLSRKFALLGLGFSYRKSKSLQVVANLSQNYRSVTFSDIRVVSPTFIVDPDISDERGFTADVGVKGRFSTILSYDLTLYSVLYDDRIGIILDDRANRVRKNIGQAIIAGTESLVNLNLSRWITPGDRDYNLSLFANVAYTYSEYIDSEENNVVGNKVEFIPSINIKTGINASYKLVAMSYQYSFLSEQFTDVQNSSSASIGDTRSGIIGTIPSYAISDLSLTVDLGSIEVGSGINNLWNRAYFTRRATGYPGPGIIPSDPRTYYITVSYKLN